jgi:hypothetical protein
VEIDKQKQHMRNFANSKRKKKGNTFAEISQWCCSIEGKDVKHLCQIQRGFPNKCMEHV